eukprot:325307_1
MTGSIIAIIYIENTMKSKDNKHTSKYPFANIPKVALYHWIISKQYLLSSPIKNYQGNLSVSKMTDENAIKIIKTFLKNKYIFQLKTNHLFVPQQIKNDSMQLIKYDKNGNTIRIIYDSDDDMDIDNKSDNNQQMQLQNQNEVNPSIQMLIDDANKMCKNDSWITSPCGLYWIRNPNM